MQVNLLTIPAKDLLTNEKWLNGLKNILVTKLLKDESDSVKEIGTDSFNTIISWIGERNDDNIYLSTYIDLYIAILVSRIDNISINLKDKMSNLLNQVANNNNSRIALTIIIESSEADNIGLPAGITPYQVAYHYNRARNLELASIEFNINKDQVMQCVEYIDKIRNRDEKEATANIINMYNQGYTIRDIKSTNGLFSDLELDIILEKNNVQRRADKKGHGTTQRKDVADEYKQSIIDEYLSGASMASLSRKYGYTAHIINRHLLSAGVKIQRGPYKTHKYG